MDVHTLSVGVCVCVRTYVYVCTYTCAHTHADMCVYASMHVRVRIDVHPHLCADITRIHTIRASRCVDTSACMCVCVPMYPDVSAHVSMCVHACVYPCTYVYRCLCVYTRKHTRTLETPRHTRAHTDTCVYVSMPFVRVCLYACVHVYIDAITCAYTYVHVYTHMCMRSPSPSPSPSTSPSPLSL